MDLLRVHGKREFGPEFNCWLICKQRVRRLIRVSCQVVRGRPLRSTA
jgi:hypothetical protein